ncbi:hypothetical protein JR316_0006993 [Psilocybe cubensis]|uniref:Uncharacterized protein n=2 Tax=Psilocybe cubensis TaxID=181762 RepID=A0ACB8GZK8_PSICU|nr:hypothetical protein JR316_0006993 [Psilocybe cubensis]KAH9480395.1 hypothetical protein JR316_0006993 [Psilocybe cubensis]
MFDNPYQSPWRGSIVMAPSGRYLDQAPRQGRASLRLSTGSSTSEELPPDRDIMEGLVDTPLSPISVPDIDSDQEEIQVTDCSFIGSYSWLKGDSPAILVPGSPPLWQNRPVPYTIPPDTGVQYVDQNGFRMPKQILLPLIEAVNKVKKMEFDWSSVDFVTDRNNLRKITRWVGRGDVRDFRIDLQLAGNKTVLMNRWEKRTREVFSGRTYGFSFEKASTSHTPECKDSVGHHRIIAYDLNGLKMVVRFEVDAAIPPPAKYPRRSISSIDELTASINKIALSRASSQSGKLQIYEGGSQVSSTAVVELTTRSQNNIKLNGFDWKEAYPQLFFSQTAHHFLAIHNRGRFVDIQKRKLSSDELQAVQEDSQVELKKVRRALDLIKQVVIENGLEGRISLVCRGGEMKVYKRISDDSCLPENAFKLFEA